MKKTHTPAAVNDDFAVADDFLTASRQKLVEQSARDLSVWAYAGWLLATVALAFLAGWLAA